MKRKGCQLFKTFIIHVVCLNVNQQSIYGTSKCIISWDNASAALARFMEMCAGVPSPHNKEGLILGMGDVVPV